MDTNAMMPIKRSNLMRDDFPAECRARSKASITLDAEVLFAGTRELKLIYRDEEYRLRITRNSKLILTK